MAEPAGLRPPRPIKSMVTNESAGLPLSTAAIQKVQLQPKVMAKYCNNSCQDLDFTFLSLHNSNPIFIFHHTKQSPRTYRLSGEIVRYSCSESFAWSPDQEVLQSFERFMHLPLPQLSRSLRSIHDCFGFFVASAAGHVPGGS